VQKIGLEVLGDRFRSDRGLDAVVVRPFNHVGPGLDERLSVAFFARQIVDAERGLREPVLRVGNLTARRDFTDVRDVVRAYLELLAQDDCPPCVHVASGRSISLSEVLDELRRRARIPLTVETDPNRLRPVDAPDLVGDAGLLRRVTGWEPVHPLAETWDRVLAHARGDDYGGPW
jgi:GDP-4-dehydro-6-deoxy-D-mannose reductase